MPQELLGLWLWGGGGHHDFSSEREQLYIELLQDDPAKLGRVEPGEGNSLTPMEPWGLSRH
jgi:hypothetical protein